MRYDPASLGSNHLVPPQGIKSLHLRQQENSIKTIGPQYLSALFSLPLRVHVARMSVVSLEERQPLPPEAHHCGFRLKLLPTSPKAEIPLAAEDTGLVM